MLTNIGESDLKFQEDYRTFICGHSFYAHQVGNSLVINVKAKYLEESKVLQYFNMKHNLAVTNAYKGGKILWTMACQDSLILSKCYLINLPSLLGATALESIVLGLPDRI